MMKLRFVLILLILLAPALVRAELTVASLHPLIADLARNVGGSKVVVIDIMEPGDDVHEFAPTPSDMVRLSGADIILLSGKGLEKFKGKLEANLKPGQQLVEVGRKVPSKKISANDELYVCCPTHSAGSIDPHWWHSISSMKRAAKNLADVFGDRDQANRQVYLANARKYGAELDRLEQWAQSRISTIPRSSRVLATAHAAFGYFCDEFGFKSLPVQGLKREQEPTSKYLAESVDKLRENKVTAVFPEAQANPKVLKQLASEAGVRLGGVLIADGSDKGAGSTYVGMMRYNIGTITSALSGS